ncbi:WD40 repeat-like protein, partial [Hortaea werneckii]
MDVHRARFVPYPTSSISALAFSRTSDAGYTGPLPALKLAIGRSNGNIEIWNPQKGAWVQEAVFLGDGKSIDGLAWTQDPDEVDGDGNATPGQQRLFSIASSPNVAEWDLGTGMVKRRSTGNFSEVWCFASQPRWKAQKKDEEARSQDLVAGCGDGALVLLSTADDDLQFKRNLARVSGKKARCMCITYQKPEVVVAGFADSMIRIYDTRNGSQLRQMSLGTGLPGAPKTALVWQVKILPNGDIVSGDSNGEVRIWDGKHYALSRRLTGHDSDCLDLITSSDGKTIFSGSLDGKMAVYRQSANDGGRNSWAKSSHRRMHNGEVKAMAAFDSSRMSVVISGGSDVTPVATPLREYGKENVRFLPTLPQEPQVTSAPKARLLVCWWEKSVLI